MIVWYISIEVLQGINILLSFIWTISTVKTARLRHQPRTTKGLYRIPFAFISIFIFLGLIVLISPISFLDFLFPFTLPLFVLDIGMLILFLLSIYAHRQKQKTYISTLHDSQ